ncbi:MAG TPA: DNA-binding protein, partial [Clostridium sp.]|nr:DNA-binding protein [Clostridium sp.]
MLIPKGNIVGEIDVEDEVDVFVYRDSKD